MKFIWILGAAIVQAFQYKSYVSPISGDTIFEHRSLYQGNIPKDCEIWTDGCTSCGARDGKLTFCSMVICQYSKCLPHCSKYKNNASPPDYCEGWNDGCNTCFLTKSETPAADGQPGSVVKYTLDENSVCSKFMCSPIAWGKPQCTKRMNCMVDINEQQSIDNLKEHPPLLIGLN